jgi:rhamnogalacturonan endolyase
MHRITILLLLLLAPLAAHAQRQMEDLGRGVVAVRTGANTAFVSWRVLGLDEPTTGFNLYRSTDRGAPVRLNSSPLMVSNYTDADAPVGSTHAYAVKTVVDGVEETAFSGSFTLAANGPVEPAVRIPLQGRPPGYRIHFVWVGDLTGDGEYDFVLDRLPSEADETQKLEAYTRRGELLWVVDLGPGSLNRNNIEPGPSAINVGHWDGVTVFDFDGDGRAEVALRTADGVIFGDGKTLSGLGGNHQAVSILDGLTGAERARAPIPTDYLSDGPMPAHFGVAYLNGSTPSLVTKLKNRVGRGPFNLMIVTWDFDGNELTKNWKWLRGNTDAPDAHQIRVFDVTQDGRDEIIDGGYALNPDGTFRYKVGGETVGVIHGDRFHIGNFNPGRPGLEGFKVQQNHPGGLRYLVFDAENGEPIHTHFGEVADVGRGMVADFDPAYPGYEYWAFDGIHRIDTGELITEKRPWPNFRIWWDGDLLAESLNEGKVEKWDPKRESLIRLFTVGSSDRGVSGTTSWRGAPQFYGDILGDWREEIISTNGDYTELIIITTDIPTEHRIYTLAHNPAYRVAMAIKGYLQSHYLDYYLGHGMSSPPRPNIRYTPRSSSAERAAR